MTLTESLISGIVQGVTEFLPVSSSGHLVLVHSFFGMSEPALLFDILLHVSTLLAVLLFFRRDIRVIIDERRYDIIAYIAIATVPAVAVGLLWGDIVESIFASPRTVGLMLVVTGIVLATGQKIAKTRSGTPGKLGYFSAFIIGLAQSAALMPGISRSGMTISAALAAGVDRERAFSFSFLLSIPAVLGALIYSLLKGSPDGMTASVLLLYAPGIFAAFFAGLCSLYLLRKVVVAGKLAYFSVYCITAGMICVFLIK